MKLSLALELKIGKYLHFLTFYLTMIISTFQIFILIFSHLIKLLSESRLFTHFFRREYDKFSFFFRARSYRLIKMRA